MKISESKNSNYQKFRVENRILAFDRKNFDQQSDIEMTILDRIIWKSFGSTIFKFWHQLFWKIS